MREPMKGYRQVKENLPSMSNMSSLEKMGNAEV